MSSGINERTVPPTSKGDCNKRVSDYAVSSGMFVVMGKRRFPAFGEN